MNRRISRWPLGAIGLVILVALTVATGWPLSVHPARADADLTINPTSGPPGTTVTISPSAGTSTYPAGTDVTLDWVDCSDNLQTVTAQVGASGQVPTMAFTVPASSSPCQIEIVVLMGQSDVYGPYYFDVTNGTPTPTATATATPAPRDAIMVQGLLLRATVNAALSNVVVGTFTDDAGLPASSYSVTINWGDGTLGTSSAGRLRGNTGGIVHPAGVSEQYAITGSHTYASTGVFPIDVTIQAADGRTAYLSSNAEVDGASATTYQVQQGWNLLGPQLPAGATIQASALAARILAASHGRLVAIYALAGSRWSPSFIDLQGGAPGGTDFPLQGGQGYLVYSDKGATFGLGSIAGGPPAALHTGLATARRAHLPPLPALP